MGVSSHSQARTLYIFSTMLKTNKPLDNEELHGLMADYFKSANIPFIEVDGRYKGAFELSFLLNAAHVPEDAVMAYAKFAKQECYLVIEQWVHGTMKAILVDVATGKKTHIGFFRSIRKEIIDELELDYTYRPDVDIYWVVWPTDTTQMQDFEDEVDAAKALGFEDFKRHISATL